MRLLKVMHVHLVPLAAVVNTCWAYLHIHDGIQIEETHVLVRFFMSLMSLQCMGTPPWPMFATIFHHAQKPVDSTNHAVGQVVLAFAFA